MREVIGALGHRIADNSRLSEQIELAGGRLIEDHSGRRDGIHRLGLDV